MFSMFHKILEKKKKKKTVGRGREEVTLGRTHVCNCNFSWKTGLRVDISCNISKYTVHAKNVMQITFNFVHGIYNDSYKENRGAHERLVVTKSRIQKFKRN